MVFDEIRNIYKAELSDDQFDKLGAFINRETGIKMPPAKKVMVQARLKKRLKELGIPTFEAYLQYVFGKEGIESEVIHVFDAISTNKTDFFREPVHFSFLKEHVLPEFKAKKTGSTLKVWSAACSSGEEPYTLAMSISEFLGDSKDFDFRIHGTDISTLILKMALNAVFTEERLRPAVPEFLVRKYFMKSSDPVKRTYRAVPELRQKLSFSRLNFMDENYPIAEKFDVVFCRNVLIYFDREVQEAVVQKICRYLKSGGYFFHGHSESLIGMNLPLKNIRPTVFQKI
jgi:chemotaxis protein methyltransferase CheR